MRMLPRPPPQGADIESPPNNATSNSAVRKPSKAPPLPARAKLMAVRCRVCRTRNERDVNLAFLSGEPVRSIEQRTGFSKSALLRHFHSCVPKSVIMARQSGKIADAEFVTAELCKMIG